MNKEEKMLRLVKNPKILEEDELIEQITICSPPDFDDKEGWVQWVKDSIAKLRAAIDSSRTPLVCDQSLPAGQRFKHCLQEVDGVSEFCHTQYFPPSPSFWRQYVDRLSSRLNVSTSEHLTDAVGYVLPNPYKEENEEE